MRYSKKQLITIMFAVFYFSSHNARADARVQDWQSDCVGLLQIQLPGAAETAAHPLKTILSDMIIESSQPETYFTDGQKDGYASFDVPGRTLIGHPASMIEIKMLLERMRLSRAAALQRHKRNPFDDHGNRRHFSKIDVTKNNTFGWKVDDSYSVVTFIGSIPVLWEGKDLEFKNIIKNKNQQNPFQQLLQAEPRSFGIIPTKNGLCLPYIFLPAAQHHRYFVAATYRLKSHPDVTVWLQHNYAATIEGNQEDRFRKPSTEHDNEFFWTLAYQSPDKYRSLWHWPYLQNVKLAGINGKSSFMELTREGGTIDYGYFASARTDETQKNDWTNVQIFVIRNAKNAITKDLQPIDKDEFLKMAQAIATSIKIRSITSP